MAGRSGMSEGRKLVGEHGKGRHKDFWVICHKKPHLPPSPATRASRRTAPPPHPAPSATLTKSGGPAPAAPKPTPPPTTPSSNKSDLPFTASRPGWR